jgi:hypothetical protein
MVEVRVDPQMESRTEVVVHEVIVEDAAVLRSAPMLETRTSSRGGLELLDDELIDPTIMSLNMESWCHTKQWIKICCGYPE